MGVDVKKVVPPLPAPTDSNSTDHQDRDRDTEVATELSRVTDKTSYSIPDDGSPITISTRKVRANRSTEVNNNSQTSLLIDYFEASNTSSTTKRRPSIRVRVTPSSKNRGKSSKDKEPHHIQITERPSGSRKASYTKRINLAPTTKGDRLLGEESDAKSLQSYSSLTEGSNLTSQSSIHPVDIRITAPRRPASPLIPTTQDHATNIHQLDSNVSSLPPDSFLDGSVSEHRRSRNLSTDEALIGATAAGLTAGAKIKNSTGRHSRSLSRERTAKNISSSKDKSDTRSKHRDRSRSIDKSDKHNAGIASPHRRSSRGQQDDSLLSTDSSYLSASRTSKVSSMSINNPKLLETVEDAIRRLILPELNALKKENKANAIRRESQRERRNSHTSASSGLSKEHSDLTTKTSDLNSLEDPFSNNNHHRLRSSDAPLNGGARSKDGLMEREERRRRRKERNRHDSVDISQETAEQNSRLPTMSDMTESDMTKTSVLSQNTDQSHSTSHEHTAPVRQMKRGYISPVDSTSTILQPTTLQFLGVKHANTSIADIELSNDSLSNHDRHEHDHPGRSHLTDSTYDGSFIEDHQVPFYRDNNMTVHNASNSTINNAVAAEAAAAAMLRSRHTDNRDISVREQHDAQQHQTMEEYRGESDEEVHQPYGREYFQTVPSPLRYVPYNQERRGLSPIPQSVSSYREDENKTNRSTSMSTINESIRQKATTPADLHQHNSPQTRQGGQNDSGYATETTVSREQQNSKHDHDHHNLSHILSAEQESKVDSTLTSSSAMGSNTSSGVKQFHTLGATPAFVYPPIFAESNVASLHSGTNVSQSNVTADPPELKRQASYASFDEGSERNFTHSPTKGYRRDDLNNDSDLESPNKYPEYELDDQGRKITMPDYTRHAQSDSYTVDKKTMGAATAAAAAAIARYAKNKPRARSQKSDHSTTSIPQRNRSFKERASELREPSMTSDMNAENVKLGASGLPDMHDPMPEIGHYNEDVSETGSVAQKQNQAHVENDDGRSTPKSQNYTYEHEAHTPGLQKAEIAMLSAAGELGASAAIARHERETGHIHNDEWQRTSDERKRDTIMTNPFEGQSPSAIHGDHFIYDTDFGTDKLNYDQKDEGYVSSAPAPQHSIRRKEVGFSSSAPHMSGGNGPGPDPFYAPRDKGGSVSPVSDFNVIPTTYSDDIQHKDVIALMNHLTVRDAQRSARDTEILMTLVQAAAEMRNSFVEMRKLILDSEDVIIQEVERNTDNSVRKSMIDAKPMPQGLRRLKAGSDDFMNDVPAKRRNVFRRALASLGSKSSHDLAHIEDMLVRLLGDVEGLKMAGKRGPGLDGHDGHEQEGYAKRDDGYEPEGHAESSAASRSGNFSSTSRNNNDARPLEQTRKFSENRVSTVHEDDEEDVLDSQEQTLLDNQFEKNEQLMTKLDSRGASLPPHTPPRQFAQPAAFSNENTPTDKSKKHKSTGSNGFIPKISRWSETTASTIANKFKRNSKQKDYDYPPSRSGSHFDQYDTQHRTSHDRFDHDNDGTSQQDIDEFLSPQVTRDSNRQRNSYVHNSHALQDMGDLQEEEPTYTAQRHSLLIAHPQPTHGPTAVHRSQLEGAAHTFGPVSPQSVHWDSTTSVNRLPPNANIVPIVNHPASLQIPIRSHSELSDYDYDDLNTYIKAGKGKDVERAPMRSAQEEMVAPPRPPKEKLDSSASPHGMYLSSNVQTRQRQNINDIETEERLSAQVQHQIPRSFSGGLGKFEVPTRKPTGPRAMAGKSAPGVNAGDETGHEHTHIEEGIMQSPKSYRSNDTETF